MSVAVISRPGVHARSFASGPVSTEEKSPIDSTRLDRNVIGSSPAILKATVADCCCPRINFHADPQQAQTYLQGHPGMTGELLGQADAVERARRIFGGLLDSQQRQAMGDNDSTR
jgi:hypothetical protein